MLLPFLFLVLVADKCMCVSWLLVGAFCINDKMRYLSKRYRLADWLMIISLCNRKINERNNEIYQSLSNQNSKRSWGPLYQQESIKPLTLFNKALSTLLRGRLITITLDFFLSCNRINENVIRARANVNFIANREYRERI